jgi:release factor glutamine methyltransferase
MRPVKAAKLLRRAEAILKSSPAIDHWQQDRELIEAEELLLHVLGEDPDPDQEIPTPARQEFEGLVARRAEGEPIPYIKGYSAFRDIELIAQPGVFVPRDSSEWLAEQAIRRLRGRERPILVDLATGGGTIALAVADEVPKAEVFGSDVAADAVKLARRNAKRLGLKATFARGDLFGPLPRRLRGAVDVITLHPPYVARGEMEELPDEIREWEPEHTLTDRSVDGLGLVQRTAAEAPDWLARKGWLLVEVSPDRAKAAARVLTKAGFRDVERTKGGELKVTRVIVGRRPA